MSSLANSKLPLDNRRAAEVVARATRAGFTWDSLSTRQLNEPRYFLLMAGIGLDAAVVRQVSPRFEKDV